MGGGHNGSESVQMQPKYWKHQQKKDIVFKSDVKSRRLEVSHSDGHSGASSQQVSVFISLTVGPPKHW